VSTSTAISPTEPTITMTRVFDAPREDVWEAFTDPANVAQWFGGEGFVSPVCTMDVRPGGLWNHVMRAPNGAEFRIDSVFLEVVPPELLVWKNAVDVKAQGGPPNVMQSIRLEALGSKTRMTLVATFGSLADRDISAKMGFAEMVRQGIERLATLLARS